MLPTNQLFVIQARLGSLDFNEGEILKVIRALNINKALGHDDISIRMVKICDELLLKPFFILFKNSLKLSYYPDISTIYSFSRILEKYLRRSFSGVLPAF